MSDHRPLSRRRADRVLDASADHPVGPVGDVLSALRAPGRPDELAGEDATVAAFHAARLVTTPHPRSDMSPSRTAPVMAAKAALAAGAVVAVTGGGFALAATGHLPTLPDQASDRASEAVAKHGASETTATAGESATTAPTTAPTEGETTEPGTPSPRLAGLCKAFQAHDKSLHGKALDSAAFTALADAAGSKAGIATYCVTLVGEPKGNGKPSAKPTSGNRPSEKPGNKPSEKPGNKPSEKPGNKPSEKPGNKPSENPGNKPSENPGNKPSENPGNKPSENPGNKPSEKPGS